MIQTSPFSPTFCRRVLKGLAYSAAAIALVAMFRSTVLDWDEVPSGSMLPTIVRGDRILENKLAYDLKLPFTRKRVGSWADPRLGDIVVFASPRNGKSLVKRIVGLPGDRLTVGGTTVLVPDGKYFLVGDDPELSFDSRSFGPVGRDRILGKAVGVIASFDAARHDRPRWSRFFTRL